VTIRTRIAVVAAAAVAVAVVLASFAAFFAARRELRAEIDESLIERAVLIERAAEEIRPFIEGPIAVRGIPGLGRGPGPAFDTLYYQLIAPDGTPVFPTDQAELPSVNAEDLASGPVLEDIRVDRVHMRMVSFEAGGFGIVQIARPLTEVDATLSGLAAVLLLVGVVGTLLAGAIGLVIARSALKPIDDLTNAAEHVAETQDLESRIEVESQDEVGRLATSFNAMLAALEDSRAQQRRLVRDAGHELRTPLTALRTNIELLARSKGLPDLQRRELLDAATAEVEELSALVSEVVDLASDRYAEEPIVAVRLDEVAATSVDRFHRRTGRTVDAELETSWIEGRPAALDRAVTNLLDNAGKWSPDGEPIRVSVADGMVLVRDAGPGIDDADKPFIFERFYRSPKARSQPGSGLGLSIVKQIVDDLDGEVFVADGENGGAAVGIQLRSIAPSSEDRSRSSQAFTHHAGS
jgi:two-component system sensor histidine kinase MprB